MPPIMRTKNVVDAVPDDAKTFAIASIAERKLPVEDPTTTDDAASPAQEQETHSSSRMRLREQ